MTASVWAMSSPTQIGFIGALRAAPPLVLLLLPPLPDVPPLPPRKAAAVATGGAAPPAPGPAPAAPAPPVGSVLLAGVGGAVCVHTVKLLLLPCISSGRPALAAGADGAAAAAELSDELRERGSDGSAVGFRDGGGERRTLQQRRRQKREGQRVPSAPPPTYRARRAEHRAATRNVGRQRERQRGYGEAGRSTRRVSVSNGLTDAQPKVKDVQAERRLSGAQMRIEASDEHVTMRVLRRRTHREQGQAESIHSHAHTAAARCSARRRTRKTW